MKTDRLKILYINADVLLHFLQIRPLVHGLPKDAEVVRVFISDRYKDRFLATEIGVVVRSAEFEEVVEGNTIPDLRVTLERANAV